MIFVSSNNDDLQVSQKKKTLQQLKVANKINFIVNWNIWVTIKKINKYFNSSGEQNWKKKELYIYF